MRSSLVSSWAGGDQAYRRMFERKAADAHAFEPGLLSIISRPIAISLSEEYLNSSVRLMIMGQETHKLQDAMTGLDPVRTYLEGVASYRRFDFAEGGEPAQRRSPFWTAFRRVCREFDVAEPRGAAWSNLVKVQCSSGGSAAFTAIPNEHRDTLLEWQRELFEAELSYARPKKLMLFTGPRYDWILRRMMPDLELRDVPGIRARKLQVGRSQAFGCDVVRTYHPAYLRRRRDEAFVSDAARILAQFRT